MKKLQFTLAIALLLAAKGFAQSSQVIREYILRYKDIAMEEMQRTGIPAAITLAQGIHETSAGQSELVLKSNNHFGIKCKAEWTGPSVSHDDDARGECFRKYSSPFDSYRDHSDFLTSRSHYSSLFKLDPTDYEAWAYGLKKAGYATNPKYPQILIKLIRDYNLQDYTLIAMGSKNKPDNSNEAWVKNRDRNNNNTNTASVAPVIEQPKKLIYPSGVFKINDTKVVFVNKGTSYLAVAKEYDVQLNRLFEFNDMRPQEVAMNDQLIYLQRKRRTGANEFHTVTNGESLHEIAQAEGIRIENLLAYNFLNGNMQPQAGEKLYLHGKAPAMPKLMTAAAIVTVVSKSNDFAKASDEERGTEASFLIHKVQTKETMYSIAKRYGVTPLDIIKWNELESMNLKTGQQLRIKRI